MDLGLEDHLLLDRALADDWRDRLLLLLLLLLLLSWSTSGSA
jgi:hypothetical protein